MASSRICCVEDCGNRVKAKDFCEKHWDRFKKFGDHRFKRLPEKTYDIALNSEPSEECFIWPHARDQHGYGLLLSSRFSTRFVHRMICIETHGTPDEGMEAAHSCGKGHLGCVSPHHVSWKTRQGNIDDRRTHGTLRIGEGVAASKLTSEEVIQIRSIAGWTTGEISRLYGVSPGNIAVIRRNLTWKHLLPSSAPMLDRSNPP